MSFGVTVDMLAERNRIGKWVAMAVIVGWVGWGCVSLARDVQARFVRSGYPPFIDSAG
jgi:hypothetical protein